MDEEDSDMSDSDEDDRSEQALLLLAVAYEGFLATRADAVFHQRVLWNRHVETLQADGTFNRTYRMPLQQFNKLLGLLRPHIGVDIQHSTSRTGVMSISPEIILHCVVRWLAGGSYLDIRNIAKISVPSFYRVLWVGIGAIRKCDALAFSFPRDPVSARSMASNFAKASSFRVLRGCVGCLDGMLCRIKTHPRSDTRAARFYHSGHYHAMGVNIQAVCDHLCRFTCICVAAPGAASDVTAFGRTQLKMWLPELPIGYYVIADNAYVPTEHLITPFSGSQKDNADHDSYNYYVSQLRIKIEQAFGLMTTKWRILRTPLHVKLENVGAVVLAIARLHNFCISERPDVELAEPVEPLNVSGGERGFLPSDPLPVDIPGLSVLRGRIVRHIASNGLVRPKHNLNRNNGSS